MRAGPADAGQAAAAQDELARKTFTASAGAGMVTVECDGKGQMRRVKLDPTHRESGRHRDAGRPHRVGGRRSAEEGRRVRPGRDGQADGRASTCRSSCRSEHASRRARCMSVDRRPHDGARAAARHRPQDGAAAYVSSAPAERRSEPPSCAGAGDARGNACVRAAVASTSRKPSCARCAWTRAAILHWYAWWRTRLTSPPSNAPASFAAATTCSAGASPRSTAWDPTTSRSPRCSSACP